MGHAGMSLPEPPPARLPEPPPTGWGTRALLRFAIAHFIFLAACFAVGETVWLIILGQPEVYELGPGKEFPTLQAAEAAVDVATARTWMAIGVFSMLVVLAVWLWKHSFRWFWIPLAMVPYLGPLFFASPATWVLVNGNTRAAGTHGGLRASPMPDADLSHRTWEH